MDVGEIRESLESEYKTYNLYKNQRKYALPCVTKEKLDELEKHITSSHVIIMDLEEKLYTIMNQYGYYEKKTWMVKKIQTTFK